MSLDLSSRRPHPVRRRLLAGLVAAGLCAGLTACAGSGAAPLYGAGTVDASAPIAPTADAIQPDWKERLSESYVFLEHVGDYRAVGDTLRALFAQAREAGLAPSGPPFTLYYDDPGRVPLARLRARACLPVEASTTTPVGLARDVLPQAMVVYGRVAGAYDQVPRAYPKLLSYLQDMSWSANGPIREVYLVDPGAVESWDELVTEVQIPWTVR